MDWRNSDAHYAQPQRSIRRKDQRDDLRHYNASIMLALNVPDKYAMERMGYSTPATLKKVYQHTMAGKRAEVNSMINSHMNEMFTHDENKQERGVVG